MIDRDRGGYLKSAISRLQSLRKCETIEETHAVIDQEIDSLTDKLADEIVHERGRLWAVLEVIQHDKKLSDKLKQIVSP